MRRTWSGVPGGSIDGLDVSNSDPVDCFDFGATFAKLSGQDYACFVVD
jgi:hypothetical protein